MEILMLIAIAVSVLAYFFVLYKAMKKNKFTWADVAIHLYLVFMILTLAFIARNIF